MKKVMMAVAVCLTMTACEKAIVPDGVDENETAEGFNTPTKKFTFTVKGDFGSPTFMQGDVAMQSPSNRRNGQSGGMRRSVTYLTNESNQMTDLWVFDFVGDECMQSLHQTTSDETWGQPQMSLTLGTHHVYFVASRGVGPVVDGQTITWSSVRDTFWKDYEVTVVNTSNGNRAVTLDRVVSKLKITINDVIPTGAATLSVTPATWYYGLNYRTGAACGVQNDVPISVSIPSGYIGTTGLAVSFFTISAPEEWTTDIAVAIKDGNGTTLGSATIDDAPMKGNRSAEYSGNMFSGSNTMTVALNSTWDSPVIGNF